MNRSLLFLKYYGLLIALALTAVAQSDWTLRNQNNSGDLLWSIVEGNAGMVAVGSNGKILHSADGLAWTNVSSGTQLWLVAVTYGKGKYVAVGEKGTILTSIDGETWTPVTLTGTTARLNNIHFDQDKFVAVGEGGTIILSTDGISWTGTTSNATGWLHGLAYSHGHWVATGQSGTIITSTDGANWTTVSTYITANLEAVAFGESLSFPYSNSQSEYYSFVAVGDQGTAIVLQFYRYGNSPEYDNFYAYITTTGTNVRLGSIAVCNKVYVATGDNGTVITASSYNGPWSPVSLGSSKLINASGFGRDSLFLAGEGETIFQSAPIFPSRLANISTRGQTSAGANVMIAGTIVQGNAPKRFLIRGVGPKLSSFGLTGALSDPVLTIYNASGKPIATNTGWSSGLGSSAVTAATKQINTFALDQGSADSALVTTLDPGAYTFQVASASGRSGVVLAEAYDLDEATLDGPRAINISTRGRVGTDANILIAGFIIQGPSARTLLVRGVGPTLESLFSLPDSLADPVITIYGPDQKEIATNDNWETTTKVYGRDVTGDEVLAATARVGAFPLTKGGKDAALLVNLAPGAYTVHVSGKNRTSGVGLVEAYELPSD